VLVGIQIWIGLGAFCCYEAVELVELEVDVYTVGGPSILRWEPLVVCASGVPSVL